MENIDNFLKEDDYLCGEKLTEEDYSKIGNEFVNKGYTSADIGKMVYKLSQLSDDFNEKEFLEYLRNED